jgi:membrane protein
MARLRDVPHVLKTVGPFTFLIRVWKQLGEDAVFTWGSALAYSWLFAIFPFLIFLLSLVPMIPEQFRQDVKPQVKEWIDRSVPSKAAADIIETQANNVLDKPRAGGFLSFGLLLTIWGASGGMAMTMSALDKAYDIEKSRGWFRQRLVALMMTAIVASLVIAVMILMPVGTGVIAWLVRHAAELNIPLSSTLLVLVDFTRYAIALLLLIAITAIIYHFGPFLKQRFRFITPGALFAIGVWLLLGYVFRVYITKFGGEASYNKTYGTVAGLVILLLFFYIDALVLLVGAEINSEIDFAIAGLPKGDAPEQKLVAPLKDEETEELRRELIEKRSDDDGKNAADAKKDDNAFKS